MYTTKAMFLKQVKEPLVFDEAVEIQPLKRGQVLVELAYTGVCHTQIMEAYGFRGEDKFLPHMLGHEGAGRVLEVGEGVTKVAPGDRVVLGWIKGDGINAEPAKYKSSKGEVINAGGVTTFQEKSVVSENRLAKLPDDIPMSVAVLFGCALPTGAGIVLNTMKPPKGSTVAVWGLGGIGLSALMATQVFECDKVIAIDVVDSKLEMAKELGATHVINPQKQDAYPQILELTNGQGVDFCVEAAGLTATIENAHQIVKKNGGQCIFASHPPAGEKISIDPFEMICGKNLKGSWGGDSYPDRDVEVFSNLYREKILKLEKMISPGYQLKDLNQALEDLHQKKIMRALVEINSEIQ